MGTQAVAKPGMLIENYTRERSCGEALLRGDMVRLTWGLETAIALKRAQDSVSDAVSILEAAQEASDRLDTRGGLDLFGPVSNEMDQLCEAHAGDGDLVFRFLSLQLALAKGITLAEVKLDEITQRLSAAMRSKAAVDLESGSGKAPEAVKEELIADDGEEGR